MEAMNRVSSQPISPPRRLLAALVLPFVLRAKVLRAEPCDTAKLFATDPTSLSLQKDGKPIQDVRMVKERSLFGAFGDRWQEVYTTPNVNDRFAVAVMAHVAVNPDWVYSILWAQNALLTVNNGPLPEGTYYVVTLKDRGPDEVPEIRGREVTEAEVSKSCGPLWWPLLEQGLRKTEEALNTFDPALMMSTVGRPNVPSHDVAGDGSRAVAFIEKQWKARDPIIAQVLPAEGLRQNGGRGGKIAHRMKLKPSELVAVVGVVQENGKTFIEVARAQGLNERRDQLQRLSAEDVGALFGQLYSIESADEEYQRRMAASPAKGS